AGAGAPLGHLGSVGGRPRQRRLGRPDGAHRRHAGAGGPPRARRPPRAEPRARRRARHRLRRRPRRGARLLRRRPPVRPLGPQGGLRPHAARGRRRRGRLPARAGGRRPPPPPLHRRLQRDRARGPRPPRARRELPAQARPPRGLRGRGPPQRRRLHRRGAAGAGSPQRLPHRPARRRVYAAGAGDLDALAAVGGGEDAAGPGAVPARDARPEGPRPHGRAGARRAGPGRGRRRRRVAVSLALPSWSAAVGRSGTAARPPLFLLLGLALLHFWRWGYAYGNSDQDELLPQVLHRLEPALFARDWFVLSQADGVTVRTVFVELLRLLGLVVPLPVAVGLLHFGVLVAVGWGAYRLGYALVPDRLGASVGAFLAVVLLPHWTLGGNRLTYAQVAPENLAWALALPAVWLFLHRRRLAAAVLLGLTAWMQLLVGAQTAAVLAAVALWEAGWERSVRGAGRAVLFGLVAAAVAAPVALPAVLAPPMEGPTVPGVTAFHALARLRVPPHYLPSPF